MDIIKEHDWKQNGGSGRAFVHSQKCKLSSLDLLRPHHKQWQTESE